MMNASDHDPTQRQPDAAPAGDPKPDPADFEARLAEAEARVIAQREAYLRAAADLENVRRRAAREVAGARQFGAEKLATALLPALDSLELGLSNSERADAATLVEGQRATLKLLLKALEEAGITELDPQGEAFNPELHEAMAVQPAAGQAPDTVVNVVQKGYVLNGRLLRPARVIVAGPAGA